MDRQKGARCLYEVLGLEVYSSDEDDLKRAYRKAALVWHPDKHGSKSAAELEEVHARFLEVQEAYRVLSNPQEKAWYDDHREDILRGAGVGGGGGGGDGEGGDASDNLPNLWPFFSSRCYASYDDADKDGFYAVYEAAFATVWAAEPSDAKPVPPSFGNSQTPWKRVRAFYMFWCSFVSQSTFAWADRWRVPEGDSRDVRRQMKKENDRLRAAAKRKWHETVRQLATHVKQRDKRVLAEQKRATAEADAEKGRRARDEEARRAERLLQRQEAAQEGEQMDSEEVEFWDNMRRQYGVGSDASPAKADSAAAADQPGDDEASDDEDELHCAVCDKHFKSDGQMRNHNASKKHREMVAKLREELLVEGEVMPAELESLLQQAERATAAPQPQSPPSSRKNKKKANVRKKQAAREQQQQQQQQQQTECVTADADDGSSRGEATAGAQEEDVGVVDEGPAASAATAAPPAAKTKKKRRAKKDKAAPTLVCATCHAEFETRTALFKHLEVEGHAKPL